MELAVQEAQMGQLVLVVLVATLEDSVEELGVQVV